MALKDKKRTEMCLVLRCPGAGVGLTGTSARIQEETLVRCQPELGPNGQIVSKVLKHRENHGSKKKATHKEDSLRQL